MSNITITLDMDRVQSAVQAQIRPAVDSALASHDLKKIIEKALKEPAAYETGYATLMYSYMGRTAPEKSAVTLLDKMVQDSIQELAKQFVERELRNQRGEIEGAFRAMMANSSNKLVKTFTAALQKALSDEWAFKLDVEVSHVEARDSSHDD